MGTCSQTDGAKSPETERNRLEARWDETSSRFLEASDGSWKYAGDTGGGPRFGWKLHISATIINATDVLLAVGPYLKEKGVCFKAPAKLAFLAEMNDGLGPAYSQVGKFLTIYPEDQGAAVEIAGAVDTLTRDFPGPIIPFDRRFRPGSSVFYRYGAFLSDESGDDSVVVEGRKIPDDRKVPVPEGIADPFINQLELRMEPAKDVFSERFRVFSAISQRGKGGTYHAIDTASEPPRIVVIKEGRRHGATSWDGLDGYDLVSNEFKSLTELVRAGVPLPAPIEFFEYRNNAYCAMEMIEGRSLEDYLSKRVRRLSVDRIIDLSIRIANVLHAIETAGWRWGDCKPSNLIICGDGSLRPIDFEGAHPLDSVDRFGLLSLGFSDHRRGDVFSIGAVLYHLITGDRIRCGKSAPEVQKRRRIPAELARICDDLLHERIKSVEIVKQRLTEIHTGLRKSGTFRDRSKAGVASRVGRDWINYPTREVRESFLT